MNKQDLTSSRWAPRSARTQSPYYHAPSQFLTDPPPSHRHPSPTKPNLNSNTTHQQQQQQPRESPPLSAVQRSLLSRHASHLRFLRLLRRLKWKSHLLLYSHHHALNASQSTSSNGINGSEVVTGTDPGEAETMFRVDFFEWYVLFERCVVCLLAGVGVGVSAGYDPGSTREGIRGRRMAEDGVGGGGVESGGRGDEDGRERGGTGSGVTGGGGLIGDSHAFSHLGGYTHRFHENVLAALDSSVRNPLHAVLGQGRVREYIGVAKEFRNRWKDVDAEGVSANANEATQEEVAALWERKLKRYERILQDLNLAEMLECILEALERARVVAEEELERKSKEVGGEGLLAGGAGKGNGFGVQEWDMEDAPFEAGVDAMEWD